MKGCTLPVLTISSTRKTKGKEASSNGTLLHELIEVFLNSGGKKTFQNATLHREFGQFSEWYERVAVLKGWTPYRTELSMVFKDDKNNALLAGQLDALFTDECGRYILVDWKRISSKKSITDDAKIWRMGNSHITRNVPDRDFDRYSLQLAIYAMMLRQIGIEVGTERYIVRMHEDMQGDVVSALVDMLCF